MASRESKDRNINVVDVYDIAADIGKVRIHLTLWVAL